MTHKEAPPPTPEQERFEKFWLELKGPGYTGFGRGKDGGYLSEFSRDAYRAWTAAQEQAAPSALTKEEEQQITDLREHFEWMAEYRQQKASERSDTKGN